MGQPRSSELRSSPALLINSNQEGLAPVHPLPTLRAEVRTELILLFRILQRGGGAEHDIRSLLQFPEEYFSVAAAAQRKLRQPPSTRNASSSCDTSTSENAHFFAVLNDVMESSVLLGTRRVDGQAFAAWTALCKESTSADTSSISP
jgi:hypothetical protein